MTKDLMVRQNMNLNFEEMTRAAKAMAHSGYFDDAQDVSKAMVKVLAGAEIGLGPFAAMSGIHVIKGKPVLGANLIATLIKNDLRYDYRVNEISDDACEIHFFENGERVGESRFTTEDAKAAGLLNNPTWKKYPRNMLFARALSNGARWYTPGVFGGAAIYTPDEMDADIDEDGYIIDVTPNDEPNVAAPNPDTVAALDAGEMSQTGADYGLAGEDPENGHPDLRDNGDVVADFRAKIEERAALPLGQIAAMLVDAGLYNHVNHVFNALGDYPFEEKQKALVEKGEFKLEQGQRASREFALSAFDWLVGRKLNGASDEEE